MISHRRGAPRRTESRHKHERKPSRYARQVSQAGATPTHVTRYHGAELPCAIEQLPSSAETTSCLELMLQICWHQHEVASWLWATDRRANADAVSE